MSGQQVSTMARTWHCGCKISSVATLGCGCVLALMATTQRLWQGEMQMLRNRKGFTLIELLIVVVIIGILAAIAIPKFAATKDKAKLASVKTDLRNLETAQEAYFSDWSTYATSFANLQSAGELSALGRQHHDGRRAAPPATPPRRPTAPSRPASGPARWRLAVAASSTVDR